MPTDAERLPFLRAIDKRPGDPLPRLIFADFLQEREGETDEVVELRRLGNDPETLDALAWVANCHKKTHRPDLEVEDLDHPEDWVVWPLSFSDLLGASNGHAVNGELERYTDPDDAECSGVLDPDDPNVKMPDAVVLGTSREHGHYPDRWAVRVFGPDRRTTNAFTKLREIENFLEDYPVLDEEDYSRREMEATEENIEDAVRWFNRNFDVKLPEDYVSQMWRWFWDNNQRAVENSNDTGGYPSDDDIEECWLALGWLVEEDDEVEPAYWDISVDEHDLDHYTPPADRPSLFPEPGEEDEAETEVLQDQ